MPNFSKMQAFPRICVALAGEAMPEQAGRPAPDFDFFEFRLDTAPDPFEAVFEMGAFLRKHPALRVIATCRRKENGGSFAGTAADEIEMLRQAVAVGAHVVDVSLETAEELAINPHALAPLRRGNNALLLSWHDFHGTPALQPVLERMRAIGADLYKIVPTATNLRDGLALLAFLQQHGGDGTLVAMSMGMPGIVTRVLGPRFGSRFTFASGASGAETAPGQIDARALRDLYRIEAITPETEIYGVFGKPIGGSRSPLMLNTAFAATGRNAVYLPLESADADELFTACDFLRLRGASVTMPLKETILPGLSELESQASKSGAANTLLRLPDGSLQGSNTDVLGILGPLETRVSLQGKTALVLGAGGVARAAVIALQTRECRVFLANRTRARAEKLASWTGATVVNAEDLTGLHFDLVLNGTPYGMPSCHMAAPVDFGATRCDLFFDLVYNPLETPLIFSARKYGVQVVHGVEMFVWQGAAQYETWTGQAAPRNAMDQVVRASLL